MSDRLISADKLKAHYSWWKGGSREMTMDEAKSDFDTIIDLQPTVEPIKHGRWEHYKTKTLGDDIMGGEYRFKFFRCSECRFDVGGNRGFHYCPNCGARMDGTNKSVESVDLGNGFSISVNKSQVDAQGRYCPECLHSPTCYGAGISKPACKAFVPRVRYVDGGENGI